MARLSLCPFFPPLRIFIYFSVFAVFSFTLMLSPLTTLTHFFLSPFPLSGSECFQKCIRKLTELKWNNLVGKKSKAAKVWSFDDHIPVNSPPCCVSFFPNGSSRILPFYFPWNFRTDWVHVTFISCCVTAKRSNILRLRTRPCKFSHQHQEADLKKKIFSFGKRSWRPESIFILNGQGAEWNRTKSPWREQAIDTEFWARKNSKNTKHSNSEILEIRWFLTGCFGGFFQSWLCLRWMQTEEVKDS